MSEERGGPLLAEGEEPLSPEQTLSADFAIVANPVDVSADAGTDAVFTAPKAPASPPLSLSVAR